VSCFNFGKEILNNGKHPFNETMLYHEWTSCLNDGVLRWLIF
jgi:hypothetical protein